MSLMHLTKQWRNALKAFGVVTFRSVDVATAELLELQKLESLSPSHAPSRNRRWHVFSVHERSHRTVFRRIFLRALVHQIGTTPEYLTASCRQDAVQLIVAVVDEIEDTLVGCLEECICIQCMIDQGIDWTHVFLSIVPPLPIGEGSIEALRTVVGERLTKLSATLRTVRVAEVEMKLRTVEGTSLRVTISLPTGFEIGDGHVDIYREEEVDHASHVTIYRSLTEGKMHGRPILQPYDPLDRIQKNRIVARRLGTTYCHDIPSLIDHSLTTLWTDRLSMGESDPVMPSHPLLTVQRLGFPKSGREGSPFDWSLMEIEGCDGVGMVAWRLELKTPEWPRGRSAVLVANDITHQSGAFGIVEDALFAAAVEYALQRRHPILYWTANSGARVGVANEVKDKMKIKWIDSSDPNKGIEYLYLDDADHRLLHHPVHSPYVAQRNSVGHWILKDVIGNEDGLGVECLSGSGAIASRYSKAFKEGFTLTFVSGRTVGIGAYLARLGRRCIQSQQPIILTGYQALNKLLGRDVYTSQLQLGGPQIMGANGVSHHVVQEDLEGMRLVLRWLSYVPIIGGDFSNRLPTTDSMERDVAYGVEAAEKLDPRRAIAGWNDGCRWISGLVDKGSWMEAHEGWAQTVITGRARLGGMAIGVIAVETQTVTKRLPADPGMTDDAERVIHQAGQVWYPDSALKTAQAMEEFDLESLPLIILANWRGFSGGQRDLFEGILQSGALIVDRLRQYRHPVFVYLPPNCELRGGAWVVIDSKINPAHVEMYADPTANGGVLEPEGIVEIKFKTSELLKMMHRLNPDLDSIHDPRERREKETKLLGAYRHAAVRFAEMHDTPIRMQAKGIIRGIVPFKDARRFFIARLHEMHKSKCIAPAQSHDEVASISKDVHDPIAPSRSIQGVDVETVLTSLESMLPTDPELHRRLETLLRKSVGGD